LKKGSGLNKAEKKVGNLLFGVACKLPATIEKHRSLLAELVGKGNINNNSQLDFIIDYLKENQKKGIDLDLKDFNERCGIGKKSTPEELAVIVKEVFEVNKERLEKGCRKIEVFGQLKEKLPYAEGQIIKELFDKSYAEKGYKEVKEP
jgi:polyhydroxyalkanoate synthesis regulator phasin